MATLNSSNIVNNNVILTSDLLQLYDALNYVGASTQYLISLSGSLEGTASYATTASFALNGGGGGGAVTQIIAGTGITIFPLTGVGAVTVTSTAGGGGGGFPYTSSTPAVITGSLIITGSNLGADLIVTGSVIATQGFTGSLSSVDTAETASFVITAQTASYVLTAQTASFAATSLNSIDSILSQTSSKVIVAVNTASLTYLPLIFGTSSAAGTQQLNIDTDPGGPLYNPSLKSISASSFTGSLLGTASNNSATQYSLTATSASFINTVGVTGNVIYYPTFVSSSPSFPTTPTSPVSTSLNITTNAFSGSLIATTLSSSAITASSITSSFTGSLLGTSSWSTAAQQIQTVSTPSTSTHYPTFVDANNATATEESLYTDAGIQYNPNGNLLYVTSLTSSFTGSLQGGQNYATETQFAVTADYLLSTTQWISTPNSSSTLLVPTGSDVGIIWNFTGSTTCTITLNTASCKLGDQVQLFSTAFSNTGDEGRIRFTVSSSLMPNTRIIAAGTTPSPTNTARSIIQKIVGITANPNYPAQPAAFPYFHLICVSASNGLSTSGATWQLVEYSDARNTSGLLYRWSESIDWSTAS
jgi:hypothetical protein